MDKYEIANICENLYKECLREIPQFENDELLWILNGSTLCNFLLNVKQIDGLNVSDEFTKYCYDFVRRPKGDIDITYKSGRSYKFDLDNKYIREFQMISEEQRTYNFVDSNSELTEEDFEQLCTMETKSGLRFVAKKPQYLFLYKFKELLAVFNSEILNNDIDSINSKKKNLLLDVINLYNIATSYCGKEQLYSVIEKLPMKSAYLNKLYNENNSEYNKLVEASLKLIESNSFEYKNKKSI